MASIFVVYDSKYGNTKRAAETVAEGLLARANRTLLQKGQMPPFADSVQAEYPKSALSTQ